MNLANQVVLVTGASRGIGRAIATELGKQGATVIGTATSESGAQAITDYLAAEGVAGKGLVLNVTDAARCAAVHRSTSAISLRAAGPSSGCSFSAWPPA